MSCTICGRSTLPGAKLCIQCKKALKRARQETVSELDPSPRRVPAATRRSLPENSGGVEGRPVRVRLGGRTSPSRMGLPASLVALGIVVVTTGYFVSHLRGASDVSDPPAAHESAPLPQALTGGAYVPLPVSPLPNHEAAPAEGAVPGLVHDAVPAATTAPAKPAKAARARDPPAAVDPSIARFASSMQPIAPPSLPQPEPAPAPEPVVPDRWQLLSEAIARCAGEGVLGGVICEQRARWQYCEGYWGRVAQCPGAIGGDFHR